MALNHPRDLDAWERWARPTAVRRAVAVARRRGRPAPAPALRLAVTGPAPRVLVAMDSANASARAAAWSPLAHRGGADVAVLADAVTLAALTSPETPLEDSRPVAAPADLEEALRGVRHVLALGHYLAAGASAHAWSRRAGVPFTVVQHGLLTPFAPPLPDGATVLTFSAADGEFWTAGSAADGHVAVGSQALWAAARDARPAAVDAPTVFLGQLHGRELGRADIVRQTVGFLRSHPEVVYRPHPAERDALSRAAHTAMRRAGVRIDDSARPLTEAAGDVVSVFSTGVLETVAAGRRGWVHHPAPPAWLEDFWSRYGMERWSPGLPADRQPRSTTSALIPTDEPARAVARHVFGEET